MGVQERTISVRGVYSVTASYDVILKEINLPGIRIDIKVGNKSGSIKIVYLYLEITSKQDPNQR
jgi:hypothetical protein